VDVSLDMTQTRLFEIKARHSVDRLCHLLYKFEINTMDMVTKYSWSNYVAVYYKYHGVSDGAAPPVQR
jgi:hypothetical protein